ncbi:4-hydroxybenzoate octaprenyltransferase [Leptospira perolatii]|uniref:4-hydroxybenzoate polyprenyltransferase n=1 Tax=Leptospira perolatii TaxID=2023191 RepID=A0A2M9ZII6_9LEPT|nr:UbiA-like polyprenyltransferase [Leptospira perolatii]PJZ68550.1 4-hydroxybenzoate octaprenyltransferase [Leptospira perolatii]PJZ71880.1 4-hydroxybenzoate octaprenyltransferase [Leptospira perolatii]
MIDWTIQRVSKFGSFVKFSHTLFALPFAGIACILAFLEPDFASLSSWGVRLIWILVCMVSARSAAMGFNRWADKKIDAKNPRTANREIPSGQISDRSAVLFILGFSILFFISSWFLNSLAFALSFPTLLLLFTYSYTKRFTFFCHLYLGFSIGLAPLATWVGLTGEISWIPFLWTIGLAFNLAGFDILYAIQDEEFDRKEGLHSIPAKFGRTKSLWISRFCHVLSIVFLGIAGRSSGLQDIFWIFWAVTGFLLFREQKIAIDHADGVFPLEFYRIHSYISGVLFLGILVETLPRIIFKIRMLSGV